jgi:hypothetical protein
VCCQVERSNPDGGEICRTRPDRPWGSPSLLYDEYRVSFPGVKRSRCGVDHPPPCSSVVKERVTLYLYSLAGPSWPVLGRTLPLVICVCVCVCVCERERERERERETPNCLVMRESEFHELCYDKLLFQERNNYYVPTRRSRQSWTVGAGGSLRYSTSRKHEYAFLQYIQFSAFRLTLQLLRYEGMKQIERHLHQ